ncbi:MAG TPA: ABC transporter ATP-binding protein [Clostridiales bacterium]|nr:ABC transporter ATP-binding protein [Clostridiales bacterium]
MLRLFRYLKPMSLLIAAIVVLVTAQATAELYLPERMSDIIDNGIYLDYEPMYTHEVMKNPFGKIDVKGDVEGFDEDTIPVFEMKDGFSTVDLKRVWNELYNNEIDFNFKDIPVKDSKELFNEIIIPFMDSLRPYQLYKVNEGKTDIFAYRHTQFINEDPSSPQYQNALATWTPDNPDDDYYYNFDNYPAHLQKEIEHCINRLIDFESLRKTSSKAVTVDTFLDMFDSDRDEEEEDSNVWRDNDNARKLLVSCVYSMKHSTHGNLLPIPVVTDEKGNAVLDENGNYIRIEVDAYGIPVDQSKIHYQIDDETLRPKPFPDYELIICNEVLGIAYKYEGKKWIENKLGTTKEEAEELATVKEPKSLLQRVLSYLKLSEKGGAPALREKKTDKTAEDILIPDGVTIQRADYGYILRMGGIMLLLAIFASTCAITAMFLSARVAANFSATIRSEVFKKVETFSLVEFDLYSTPSLITRSTNDISQIQNVFLLVLRTALAAPVTIIGGVILSVKKNAEMTMVLVYCVPILFIAIGVAAKIVYPIIKLIQQKVDQLTKIMRESITGIRVIRAFNQQERERKRFADMNYQTTKLSITVNKYTAILAPLIAVVMNCIMVGIVWVAAKAIANDTIDDVGSMMAVIQYATQIMLALIMLATVIVVYPRASASAVRINEVINTKLAITDSPDAQDRSQGVGRIEFKNVNFKYSPDAEKYTLENISFTCEKGKVTAIVGGTGSGKSTIVNLIPRFYDINEGDILINGQSIKDIPQKELRTKIGLVPQKSVLFSGTIRQNLQYGKEDATDEEIWEALRISQSEKFVQDKENGLDSWVEQGGRNFSGGQKQRLSIARAVVRRPEIYIFDDSFSALDFKTDAKLRQALKSITQNSTVIIVAQRIGTIMDADNILVLDDGRIVGEGKHEYLLKNCKLYRDIALSQFSEEEIGL